jgi:hypothetical protein
MKTVVIGESSGASMETIMAVYPRHKAVPVRPGFLHKILPHRRYNVIE